MESSELVGPPMLKNLTKGIFSEQSPDGVVIFVFTVNV